MNVPVSMGRFWMRSGIVPVIVTELGVTASTWSWAMPISMSAVQSSGLALGSGPGGQMVTVTLPMTGTFCCDWLFGMGYWMRPPIPSFRMLSASVGPLVWRKSSPGRVTRADAALVMRDAFGKPPGRGVIPQPAHPLEQPPPLQAATRKKIETANACRHQDSRSINYP